GKETNGAQENRRGDSGTDASAGLLPKFEIDHVLIEDRELVAFKWLVVSNENERVLALRVELSFNGVFGVFKHSKGPTEVGGALRVHCECDRWREEGREDNDRSYSLHAHLPYRRAGVYSSAETKILTDDEVRGRRDFPGSPKQLG